MTARLSLAYAPIADPGPGEGGGAPFFDGRQTVLSQYANSPIILALVDHLTAVLDVKQLFDGFYRDIWNIDTAIGYGLDLLGRIIGVKRVLRIPDEGVYLGWKEATDAQTFGSGIWYGFGATTSNYALSDTAYRRLLFAKAALNLTDCAIPSINRILTALFPNHGNCYVRDDGGMTMTYVFGADLDAVDFAIVTQSGVLPKPIGVSVSGEIA